MSIEIEYKFLVTDMEAVYKQAHAKFEITQGYLPNGGSSTTTRIRISDEDAFITVKGPTEDLMREEYEYHIPLSDARQLMYLCDSKIVKDRYLVNVEGEIWEVDIFFEMNAGLKVAELEVPNLEHTFTLPSWVGRDVSADYNYYNSNLVTHPFTEWGYEDASET